MLRAPLRPSGGRLADWKSNLCEDGIRRSACLSLRLCLRPLSGFLLGSQTASAIEKKRALGSPL